MPNIENQLSDNKSRVVVAMSGGVDSSVAAALLVDQGYEVVGMMMRLWSEPGNGNALVSNRCCTPDQMADARRVADKLGIPFYVLDTQKQFRQTIVQFFIDQHALGRTPNPCIECNRQIRFNYLLNQALALDADFLATGHYARVKQITREYKLLKAVDKEKDQSYVLHVLKQQQLAQVLFPIGEYTKTQVRDLARKFGLPVASKSESQDLCFLGDGDYRRFLREYNSKAYNPGPILDQNGRHLGQHNGLSFYTIGQRKGLGISAPEPLFVLSKDIHQNALIVAPRDQLGQKDLIVKEANWVAGNIPAISFRAQIKIRYKAKPLYATMTIIEDNQVHVRFDEPAIGVTPGQGAVFYDGDSCLGGGIISDISKDFPTISHILQNMELK